MFMRVASVLVAVLVLGIAAGTASASVSTTADQSAFSSGVSSGYTLLNLDGAPLNGHAAGYHLLDPGPAGTFAGLGVTFFGFNAQVQAGHDFQITTPGRDRLIANGAFFGGHIAINFTDAVNGVGAMSNVADGGRVRAYSGANLTGFLGEANFDDGGFGGLISTELIRSVEFTCDYNQDLACGVYDIQFGRFAPASTEDVTIDDAPNNVAEPGTSLLLLLGGSLLGVRLRSRSQ